MSETISATNKTLTLTPLGGLGEVGMNLMVLETEGTMIVVDCGVLFPDADMPGVDLVFPDLTYLIENRERVAAVFLTHGHEDHIGALPFLLREIDVPVYGTPMTLALVRKRLEEFNMEQLARLNTVRVGESASAGPFSVEYIRVTHSIIDAAALAITTPLGVVIHTGDFKIDPTPVDGETTNWERLKELGDQGVLALLSDSTNAETPGHTKSETEVGKSLRKLFAEIPGRILVATFSSNIHRVQQVIDAAHQAGKKAAVVGRSMEQNAHTTREMGFLKYPEGAVVPITDLADDPRTEAVIVTTGSQGEPMSALSRMALGEHRNVSIQKGDTVMLSSRVIPGNELSIGRVINMLHRHGADVIHARVSEIHVSGHAAREEQQKMLEWTRPRYFMPVHGELRHLINHRKLAQELGIPPERIFVMEDGDQLRISADKAEKLDPVTAGRTFVDGNQIHDAGTMILRDRQNLSEGGILVVVIGLDLHSGKLLLGPELLNRGFLKGGEDGGENAPLLDELRQVAVAALNSLDRDARSDPEVVRVRVRNRMRKHIERTMRQRPIVMPMILEM
ncbi:MAG: ribonuclease J [Nitrospirota bacterium]|nr:ribonuclease J [Nitrospirota bacterium]